LVFSSATKIFPPFRLDPPNQSLWKADHRVALTPKAFAVLEYLVARAGRLVTQEEILQALWPDTFVQPEILRKYILEIRRALADEPRNARFLETLPKRGYRFIAAVQTVAPQPAAVVPPRMAGRLVGRDPALAELGSGLDAALQGRRQVLFVTGEAGIGKTSLVDAFQEQVAGDARVRIARGQCVEGFGGKEAYYPVLEALGLLMRDAPGNALVEILRAQAPTWLMQFPAVIKPEQREDLRREILGATRERMVREICEALESFTADHGLVLILEDLHLADDSTLDLISALARRRAPSRLTLLGTYRPGEAGFWRSPLKGLKQDLLVHRLCREISLAPLTEEQIREYLSAEFPDGGFEPAVSSAIHRWSDGNPLFMVALVERLQRQGSIRRMEPDVPETLQQMLEVQLEQLAAPEQRLLRAASVSGPRFSAWAAAAMIERPDSEVEEICEGLHARQQFLRRAGVQEMPDGSASAHYEFKHTLYREVLYAQLPPTHRRQLHLRLAERMVSLATPADAALASEIAAHFEAGRDFMRAVRYLIVSASQAARRHAHADAVLLLRHALDLLAHVPEESCRHLEIGILEHLSDVLYAQGEMIESAEMDDKVVELAERTRHKAAQANALTRMARALAFLDPERCVAVCERAVEVSRSHDDKLLQAHTEMLAACWRIVTYGWLRQDAEICTAASAKIRQLSAELPAYFEILFAHVQCTQGDYEGACRTASAGIPKSIENDNLVVFLSAHSSLAHALLHLGKWGELLGVTATAVDVASNNGNTPWVGIFQATQAWLHFHAGDFAGARDRAEELLLTNTEEPPGQVRTMAMITRGFAALELGDRDRALHDLLRVRERDVQPRFFLDWYWRMVAQLGLTRAWLACGEPAKAAGEADQTLRAALATADPALKALAWEVSAQVAKAGQEWDRAAECITHADAVLAQCAVPLAAWRVHATAAELGLARGDQKEAETRFRWVGEVIRQLADSLPEQEPLRETLLETAKSARLRRRAQAKG
jgi:DNA-binding winged helix-turn-helix (wHTH) protein/tetratricopeptide (TPR) repeat protein